MAKASAYFIKGTDVIYYLRRHFGKKPTPEMLDALSAIVRKEVIKWGHTNLPRVTIWNPGEADLRQKFGGKVSKVLCWGCHKKKSDVVGASGFCGECRAKATGQEGK